MTQTVAATPTPLEELDAQRVAAIAATGWGVRVRIFQPRNLAFWVWALLVGWGAVVWLQATAHSAAYYAPAISLGFLVFALYGALFWWFTQHIDRYSSQPARLRLAAFLWGAFAATWVMAAPANNSLRQLYGKVVDQSFSLDWGAALAVPVTEEWSKGFGLILLVALAPAVVRTAFDAFVLGAFLGLGFQILEDVSYVQNAAGSAFGADQISSTLTTFVMRITTGVAGHILFTAIFCTGLAYLIGLPEQPRRVARGLGLVLTAMVIHAVWDAEGALAELFLDGSAAAVATTALLVLVPVVALVVCVQVFKTAVRGERAFVRDMLAPEVARGVLTEAEVVAAEGSRTDRKRYRKAGGTRARRRRNRLVLASVFDLTRELGEAGGATTDRVAYARSEVARLRSRAAD